MWVVKNTQSFEDPLFIIQISPLSLLDMESYKTLGVQDPDLS